MAHFIDFMTYETTGSYSVRNSAIQNIFFHGAWVSGCDLWHLCVPQALPS